MNWTKFETLFPAMVEHAAGFGVTGRARERNLWRLGVWNPRDFARGDSMLDCRVQTVAWGLSAFSRLFKLRSRLIAAR